MMRATGACAALCAMLAIAGACGPKAQPNAREDHEEEMLGPKIAEDFDEAEQRWRKDIADARWSNDDMNVLTDDPLLTDDPPRTPEEYGRVADAKHAQHTGSDAPGVDAEDARETGWDRFGKASFSVFTVAATIGMMVAPYLLL
jgi:hypothetical protein